MPRHAGTALASQHGFFKRSERSGKQKGFHAAMIKEGSTQRDLKEE
jgi:hypothetical protein